MEDYEQLYAAIRLAAFEALRDDLERALNELLEEAEREPGKLHRAEVEIGEMSFGVLILDRLEYRVLVLPILDSKRKPIPEAVHELLIEIAFPDCRLDELEYPDTGMLEQLGYEPGPYDLLFACLRERR